MSKSYVAGMVLLIFLPCKLMAAEPLNILVLYADDWRFDSLGCAGHPILKTPHIDELAKQGMRFTNSYVTTSICGVSRASLFTGQWMSRHQNMAFNAFKTPWSETYPGILRQAGYWVGHVGKWHNGKFPAKEFDFGRSYAGRHFLILPNKQQIHVTEKNELDSLEFLRTRPKDKPFCLTVAFFAAHAEDSHPKQYLYQSKSESLYKDLQIPIPKSASTESLSKLPEFLKSEKNEGRVRWHWRFDTEEKYQEYMKAYYRLATEVDAACGKIIHELKQQNLFDKTLIIFTTDNGYFHGEHGLADKWYPYEESIRVPLIIRDPRMQPQLHGSLNHQMVLNVDLAPTILNASNQAVPVTMQGADLGPILKGENPETWRKDFFYEHATISSKERIPASQAVVQTDWKYIYWPEYNVEELFDLTKDREELQNLVAVPKSQPRLIQLRKRLVELQNLAR